MVRSGPLVGAGLVPARLAGDHKGRPYGPIGSPHGSGYYFLIRNLQSFIFHPTPS